MSGTAPERLGKYEIRGTLGRGAMGVVYDGWDPVIHRRVAIKTVRLPSAEDEEAVEGLDRFKREAQAAGRLTHTNIVGIFDYGETDELAFIVMEFVEGRSLKSVLDAEPRVPLDFALHVMDDVLAGLAFSHARGVVHRDIKPANVMLTSGDQAKIADFGIARIEASSMTQAGTVLGTPAYMSPEQFAGHVVDGRSDIYSCGVMLYQLLAGERPFDGSMTSIMHKATTTTPPRPSALSITAPPALDAVVARAMAKRPEDRFETAAAFRAALAEARTNPGPPPDDSDETVIALPGRKPPAAAPVPIPAPAPTMAPAKRSKLPLILGGGIGVLACAGAVAFLLRPSAPDSVPSVAPTVAPPVAKPPVTGTPSTATPAPAPTVPPSVPQPAPEAPAKVDPAPVSPSPSPAAPPSTTSEPKSAEPPASVSPAPTPAAPVETSPAQTSPAQTLQAPPRPLADIGCSLVQTTAAGTLALAGDSSMPELARALPNTQPRAVDAPFCPVLDFVRGLGTDAATGTLALTQDSGPAPLYDDQIIGLHATMPAFAGYLTVTYVQHDGTVEPLVPGPGYPAQTFPARASIALGQPGRGSPGWRVGPPFGQDMIVAVASTAPLSSQPSTGQTVGAYLAELRNAGDALRRRGGTLSVTVLPLDTRAGR